MVEPQWIKTKKLTYKNELKPLSEGSTAMDILSKDHEYVVTYEDQSSSELKLSKINKYLL